METVRLDVLISENISRTIIRGKIVIPEQKPVAEKILSIDKSISIKDIRLLPNKVIVEGFIIFHAIYVAFSPEQSVHHFHDKIPFTTFVDLPGALPGMEVKVDVVVEEINWVKSKGCACDFDVTVALYLSAKVTEIQEIEIVTQCPNGCTCKTEEIDVNHVIGSNSKQVVISNVFEAPQQKPPIEKFLNVDAKIEITESKILNDRIILDGEVTVQILYVAMLPEQPVHQMHHTFKFTEYLEITGAKPDMGLRYNLFLEDVDVDILKGCDTLEANLVLNIGAYVLESRKITVLTDISGCNAKPQFALLKLDSILGEGSNQLVLEDKFCAPELNPPVEKVLETSIEEIKVTEQKILKNKVIVKGYIKIQIVYVALLEAQPVHLINRKIPFHGFVEISGAGDDTEADILVEVEFVSTDSKGCCLEIEMVLKISGKAKKTLEQTVIVSFEEAEEENGEECLPGQNRTYIVKEGDSLYSIGLKYGVSVGQMITANPELAEPTKLEVGMVINVPCVALG